MWCSVIEADEDYLRWGLRYRVRARDARIRAMQHQHQNILLSTRVNSTNIAPIDDALAEIESLKPREGYSYRKLATKHGV